MVIFPFDSSICEIVHLILICVISCLAIRFTSLNRLVVIFVLLADWVLSGYQMARATRSQQPAAEVPPTPRAKSRGRPFQGKAPAAESEDVSLEEAMIDAPVWARALLKHVDN